MMKCEIIRDLIPLYLDKVCSEDSRKLVEEHLAECSECRKYMKELETELEAVKQKKEEDLDEKRLLQEGAERMKEIGKKTFEQTKEAGRKAWNDVLGRISMAKNNLVVAQAYAQSAKITSADQAAKKPMISEIYKYYQARCKQSDVMDFDDLLLQTNILFRDFPEILEKYQKKFDYILVDEYQDTNYSQYLIIKRLAEQHKNICVVGDDEQSIYSFRGARIENILNFRNDYPGYKLCKLEQNYRSTTTIVDAANSIISRNKEQIPGQVYLEPSSRIADGHS